MKKKTSKNLSTSNTSSIFMMLIVVCIGIILFLASQILIFSSPQVKQVPDGVMQKRQASTSYGDYDFKPVTIGSKTYTIYMADTEERRTQGLSDVEHMNSTDGLAFVFDAPTDAKFWMKDMKFALDFVYIRDGKIVDLRQNVSPDTYPELITAQEPFTHVIELNAGQIQENGVKVGDSISLK